MKITHEIVGKGYPLVLIHGNGENHHIFDRLVEKLQNQFQCILVDYHFQNKEELTYEHMCDALLEVLHHLSFNEYDVIGFSDGAIIGLLMAMKDQHMKHLVSIGANTEPQALKPLYYYSMYLRMFCLLPFCLYNPHAKKQWHMTKLMLKHPHITQTQLESISIPVLVMAGEMDMIKQDNSEFIAKSLPYGLLKIIPHANHFLLSDAFQKTSHEIMLFLKACHKDDHDESL